MAEYEKFEAYRIVDGGTDKVFTDKESAINYCKLLELEDAFNGSGPIESHDDLKGWLDKNKHIVIDYLQRHEIKKDVEPNIRLLRDGDIIKEGDLYTNLHKINIIGVGKWYTVTPSLIGIKYDHMSHGQIGRMV